MKYLRAFVALILFSAASAPATVFVGGVYTNNVVLTAALNPIMVYSNIVFSNGALLKIESHTIVQITNGVSISAVAGATIDIEGASNAPVLITAMVGTNKWGTLSASGNNSLLTVRHAEISYGGINLGSQATGDIEDSYVHDVFSAIVANSAKFVTLRRNHVKNYSETIFNSGTIILAEDSLYENMTAQDSDALEIQGGPPGSIIRRCTFRHSIGGNSDALDFNGTSGVLVQDCLVYDFNDKGVSMGASGAGGAADSGMTISNTLIYNVNTGIAVKDGTTCGLYNVTLADSPFGIRLYQKYTSPVDGGHITNAYNVLIWGNITNVLFQNNSSMTANYCDIQGTNYPGTSNLSANPIFLNAAQHDYRLATNSPAHAGFAGRDIGALYPVGAPMALSHPRFEAVTRSGTNVTLNFWADSEKTYTIQYSDVVSGGTWQALTNLSPRPLPEYMSLKDSVNEAGARFYRIVTP